MGVSVSEELTYGAVPARSCHTRGFFADRSRQHSRRGRTKRHMHQRNPSPQTQAAGTPDIPIRIKADAVFSQRRKQTRLARPDEGIISPLIHSRLDQALSLANLHDILHLLGGIVADAESVELALSMGLVHGSAGDFERRRPVRGVQVHDVDLGHVQHLQRGSNASGDALGRVGSRNPGRDFAVHGRP